MVVLPFMRTPRSSAMRPMSTSIGGLTRRILTIGSSEWPPASSLASGFCCSKVIASCTDVGATYSKSDGYMLPPENREQRTENKEQRTENGEQTPLPMFFV